MGAGSSLKESGAYVCRVDPAKYLGGCAPLSEYSPGGRFTATSITWLAWSAWHIAPRITGAPDWFSTERYGIAAKVDSDPLQAMRVFLQTLLA